MPHRDCISGLLASNCPPSVNTEIDPQSTSSSNCQRLSKREATPPLEFLERSKRSRKLSERAIEAAAQESNSEEEEEQDQNEEQKEYRETGRQLVASSPISIRQQGYRKTRSGSKEGNGRLATCYYPPRSGTSASDQPELPSPFLPFPLPIVSSPKTFAWDPFLNQLVSTSPQTHLLNFETLIFPPNSYLGSTSPTNAERSNEFIKAQSCVETCTHSLWRGERPGRIRKHFVECKWRTQWFEERAETDVIARLCELQLEAQQKQRSDVDCRAVSMPISSRRPPAIRTSRTSKAAGQEKDFVVPYRTTVTPLTPPSLSPPEPPSNSVLSDAELMPPPPVPDRPPATALPTTRNITWIQASTGRLIKSPRAVAEPKSTLKGELNVPPPRAKLTGLFLPVRIYDESLLPIIINVHPPAFNSLTPLPPPHLLRPSAISHSSFSSGLRRSVYLYSIPSDQLVKSAGLSIEFGEKKEGEVHVEKEVRKWLSQEGAEVVLDVMDGKEEWLLVGR